ncbi:MAG: hypothetical protein ThorAB25_19090 [Candidatus Thorarchaeota archaeon AB_25]|nr:MAG: hypothetical protein ThorAB25_19090 [Candidatus Thorarchaeota archaeon AB_25]
MTEDPSGEEPKKPFVPRSRPFNPLATYVVYTGLVLVGYILFWLWSYPALIAFTMLFVIILIRDTHHVVNTYEISFARKAAIVNLCYSLTFFVVLIVNGIALSRGLTPPILPEVTELASWSPIFILGGVLGMSNIKRMYGPRKTGFQYP